VSAESKIHFIREGIENFAPMERCESCSIERLSPKAVNAASAKRSSRIIATSYRTTSARGEWEGHGEIIILIISRLFTGGAMERRDPVEARAMTKVAFTDH
jgi:hypothetical protein